MRLGATEAQKTRVSSRKSGFFSKQWNPGDTARVLYPVFRNDNGEWELLAGAKYGHQIDPEQISIEGKTFIPSLAECDADGEVVKPDLLMRFSKIAKAFLEGEKQIKLNELDSKTFTSKEQEFEVRKAILDKYDPKNTSADARKQCVRPRDMVIITECIYVPFASEVPVASEAALVTQPLSGERIASLIAILKDPQYPVYQVDGLPDDMGVLETSYAFPTGARNTAGKTQPSGVSEAYLIKSKYPKEYNILASKLLTLPVDSEMITKRAWQFIKVPESRIRAALSNYCIIQSANLVALCTSNNEDLLESVEKNLSVLDDLGALQSLTDPVFVNRMQEALAKFAEDKETNSDSTESSVESDEDIMSKLSNAPTVQEMMEAGALVEEEFVENLDL